MPANDPLYRDLDDDIRRDLGKREAQAPRAFALLRDLSALYRDADLGDTRGDLALLAIGVLNFVLARGGEDITTHEERDLRRAFKL